MTARTVETEIARHQAEFDTMDVRDQAIVRQRVLDDLAAHASRLPTVEYVSERSARGNGLFDRWQERLDLTKQSLARDTRELAVSLLRDGSARSTWQVLPIVLAQEHMVDDLAAKIADRPARAEREAQAAKAREEAAAFAKLSVAEQVAILVKTELTKAGGA